jgi:DTW domain-containing protein YfiP
LIILQHPHELRRKNRSLPFIEFCVDPSNIKVVRSRRLTEEHTSNDDELFQRLLGDPKRRPVWLIYPDEEALPLSQAIHQLDNNQTLVAVSLLFIDATWNFAREMQKASVFPSHVQKVHLDETDLKNVQPRRFDIRTPPSDQHLSTAECIALVVSKVERNPDIYSTIMKPLDLTVQRWHDFANQKKKK